MRERERVDVCVCVCVCVCACVCVCVCMCVPQGMLPYQHTLSICTASGLYKENAVEMLASVTEMIAALLAVLVA